MQIISKYSWYFILIRLIAQAMLAVTAPEDSVAGHGGAEPAEAAPLAGSMHRLRASNNRFHQNSDMSNFQSTATYSIC